MTCPPFFRNVPATRLAEIEYRLADRGLHVTPQTPVLKVLTWVNLREEDIKEEEKAAKRAANRAARQR